MDTDNLNDFIVLSSMLSMLLLFTSTDIYIFEKILIFIVALDKMITMMTFYINAITVLHKHFFRQVSY